MWGLSDKSAGVDWVSVPDGSVNASCTQRARGYVLITFLWTGEASKQPDNEPSRAAVVVNCLFADLSITEAACFIGERCAVDDECAIGLCKSDGSCGETGISGGLPCSLDGGIGVCDDGVCIESPCGDCEDDDPYTFNVCNLREECCDTDPEIHGCQ
jgi:hypothetical protein